MTRKKLFLLATFCISGIIVSAQSPIGVWKAFDSENEKPRSLIEIYQQDDGLVGKVIKLFRTPEENKNPLCFNCKSDDPRYNQPVLGMILLKGLQRKSDARWDRGEVLDPDTGSTYRCYLEMTSADKLKVRGYLGFSLFGRTKYMYRVNEYEEGTVEVIRPPE